LYRGKFGDQSDGDPALGDLNASLRQRRSRASAGGGDVSTLADMPMTERVGLRRSYIDWVRGLAVVIMILAHTTDSWTRNADRASALYDVIVRIAGMGAPLFLFLAGVAVPLAGSARTQRLGSRFHAGWTLQRRGWEIFALAFLFRFQAWLLSPGATLAGMLKVDILNIMGPALVLAALIWTIVPRLWPRVLMFAVTAAGFSLLTPLVRAAPWLAPLPDAVEWYLRPPQGRSWFTMFPWAGLLFAGALVGEAIAATRDAASERRMLGGLTGGGAAVTLLSIAGAFAPSPYTNTYFWTTSPAYYFLRIGLMTMALPAAWWWCRLACKGFSPMMQMGRTSLFIYWIHVEMVYGILSWPLHRALPIAWAFAAFFAFTGVMLAASVMKDRVVKRWRATHRDADAGASSAARSARAF
jgi:uncharacterized membrane protein